MRHSYACRSGVTGATQPVETRSTKEPHGLEAVPRRWASEAGCVRHARGESRGGKNPTQEKTVAYRLLMGHFALYGGGLHAENGTFSPSRGEGGGQKKVRTGARPTLPQSLSMPTNLPLTCISHTLSGIGGMPPWDRGRLARAVGQDAAKKRGRDARGPREASRGERGKFEQTLGDPSSSPSAALRAGFRRTSLATLAQRLRQAQDDRWWGRRVRQPGGSDMPLRSRTRMTAAFSLAKSVSVLRASFAGAANDGEVANTATRDTPRAYFLSLRIEPPVAG